MGSVPLARHKKETSLIAHLKISSPPLLIKRLIKSLPTLEGRGFFK